MGTAGAASRSRCHVGTIGGARRIEKITYPGTGNHSDFTFDPLGRCEKVVEVTGGSTTSTKVFVDDEERDGSGTVVRMYFVGGIKEGSSSYFVTLDHLGSVREYLNSSQALQAQYDYSPHGAQTKVSGSSDCLFGYLGCYTHARSGLVLTGARAYDPNAGRFLNRDPISESGGVNLFAYCANNPVNCTDSSGLQCGGNKQKDDDEPDFIVGGQSIPTHPLWAPVRRGPFRLSELNIFSLGVNAASNLFEPGVKNLQNPGFRSLIYLVAAALLSRGRSLQASPSLATTGGAAGTQLTIDEAVGFPVTGSYTIEGTTAIVEISQIVDPGVGLNVFKTLNVLKAHAAAQGATALVFKAISAGKETYPFVTNPAVLNRLKAILLHEAENPEGGKDVILYIPLK